MTQTNSFDANTVAHLCTYQICQNTAVRKISDASCPAVFATHCCDQCDVGTDTDHQIEAVMVFVVVVVVLVSLVINAM